MEEKDLLLNQICSLYFDKEENSAHLTGYIIAKNNDELICKHINQRGEYDGYIWSRVSDLYRISYNGKYDRKIAKLYNYKKQKHPDYNPKGKSLAKDLLAYARQNGYLVSIELNTDGITGWVRDFSNTKVVIECLDSYYADSDGIETVSIDEVNTISCDTDFEQDLLIISKMKK
jgi:hypothetical protein